MRMSTASSTRRAAAIAPAATRADSSSEMRHEMFLFAYRKSQPFPASHASTGVGEGTCTLVLSALFLKCALQKGEGRKGRECKFQNKTHGMWVHITCAHPCTNPFHNLDIPVGQNGCRTEVYIVIYQRLWKDENSSTTNGLRSE